MHHLIFKYKTAKSVALLFLLQIDHYTLALEEKGTRFSEKIDVDEQKQAAVFRVPSHNDVNGADFYHDFKMVSGWIQLRFIVEMNAKC